MKKLVTGLVSLTMISGACLGLTGCGEDANDVFEEALKVTVATNYTCTGEYSREYEYSGAFSDGSEIKKSQEYGKSTVKVDFDNQVIMVSHTLKRVGTKMDEEEKEEAYIFVYKGVCYAVGRDVDGASPTKWEVEKVEVDFSEYYRRNYFSDQEEFREKIIEHKTMACLFEYNDDTERYEFTSGFGKQWVTYGYRTLDEEGVEMHEYQFSDAISGDVRTKAELKQTRAFSDIGKTSVTLPDEVKQAVETYAKG